MQRPSSVTTAGILLIIGGSITGLVGLIFTLSTLFLWVPAWLYGMPVALFAVIAGIMLLVQDQPGKSTTYAKVAAGMLIGCILNCDAIALTMGIIALVMLNSEEAVAWSTGVARPHFGPPGVGAMAGTQGAPGLAPAFVPNAPQPAGANLYINKAEVTGVAPPGWVGSPLDAGIEVKLEHNPLAWLMMMTRPKVTINGQTHIAGWGVQRFQVPAGLAQVEISVPYMVSPKSGRALLEVEVGAGKVAVLKYDYPLLVTMKGKLTFKGDYPIQAQPPQSSPPMGPPGTPPAFG